MTPKKIGPYIIGEEVGSGGMGTVYLGHHCDSNKTAAVKVLPSSMAREPGFVARFEREIESLKRLSNPRIVELFESGADGDTYYYAMEYIDGETLSQLLQREKRLPWRQVVEIGKQICSALKSAHDAGIIHRDLKPSNLLIDDDGLVKLTDFGIAQVFASSKLTATGGIVGTAEFMSPEQADGRRAGKQSDLYSLGAVLYCLLTGRPPFTGATSVEVIQKHKYGRFERPSLIVPEIPSWLEAVVCKLLEKDPENRFPDAFVLSRQLEHVVKRVELSMRDTVANPPSLGDVAGTIAEEEPHQLGGATMMKELVGHELKELQSEHPLLEFVNKTPVLMLLLCLLLVGGFYWFQDDHLSAVDRFQAAKQILDGEESRMWLAAGEQLTALVAEDRSKWEEESAPYLTKVEIYRLKSALAQKQRKEQKRTPKSEPERLLLLAQNYRLQGDFSGAERVLAAMTTLLAGNDEHRELQQLARQLLDDIHDERSQLADAGNLLDFAMSRADQLVADGEVEQARQIWQSVVELYEHHAGAKLFVERSRKLLQEHSTKSEH